MSDLRNPLNAIRLSTSALLRAAPVQERRRGRKQLDTISRSVDRMERLILDLLDLSSIDAGHFSLERHVYGAQALVSEALEMLGPIIGNKALLVRMDAPADPIHVLCDRERILQVFSNLIGNAIKFTPEHGAITVSIADVRGEARFSVADTGPGIPAAARRDLFKRYWQAASASQHGKGLGLYIAKGIVEAQGGTIWVESTVGEGTTFHFTLPLHHADEEPPPAETATTPRRLLIVDDDDESRSAMRDLLEGFDYTVEEARNGLEALDRLRSDEDKPNVMLVDLHMPTMDGRQLLRMLKRDPVALAVPVVLVSGAATLREEAKTLGAQGFVQKPVCVETLVEAIEACAKRPDSTVSVHH